MSFIICLICCAEDKSFDPPQPLQEAPVDQEYAKESSSSISTSTCPNSVSYPIIGNDFTTLTPVSMERCELRTSHAIITFQPDSVKSATVVTLEERAFRSTQSSISNSFGPIITLSPHRQRFTKNFNITLLFPDIAQYPDSSAIDLLYSDTAESEPAIWKDITTDPAYSVQFGDQSVTFSTSHFCRFCLRFGSGILFHLHFEQELQIALLFRTIPETGHTTGILRPVIAFYDVFEVYGDNHDFQLLGFIELRCVRGDRIELSIQPYSFRCKCLPTHPPQPWVETISVTSVSEKFAFEDRVCPNRHAKPVGDTFVCEGRVECRKILPRNGGPTERLGSRVVQVNFKVALDQLVTAC